ncbi:hypothetical protein DFH06DRAFT_1128452 [Mycena polygramma]|nr:hypothetical protein DFH06DRAFT_1128452 [Mycena polygramma]
MAPIREQFLENGNGARNDTSSGTPKFAFFRSVGSICAITARHPGNVNAGYPVSPLFSPSTIVEARPGAALFCDPCSALHANSVNLVQFSDLKLPGRGTRGRSRSCLRKMLVRVWEPWVVGMVSQRTRHTLTASAEAYGGERGHARRFIEQVA